MAFEVAITHVMGEPGSCARERSRLPGMAGLEEATQSRTSALGAGTRMGHAVKA